jgi:hypothetical protein
LKEYPCPKAGFPLPVEFAAWYSKNPAVVLLIYLAEEYPKSKKFAKKILGVSFSVGMGGVYVATF